MKKQKSMGLLERKRIDRAQRRRKKRIQMTIGAICAVALVLVVGLVWKPWKYIPTGTKVETGENKDKKSKKEIRQGIIDEAKRLELSYAYDEAIAHLKTVDKYEKDEDSITAGYGDGISNFLVLGASDKQEDFMQYRQMLEEKQ